MTKWVVLFFVQFRILKGLLESIKGLHSWHHKDYNIIYKLWRKKIMNKMNRMVTQILQWQLDLEANRQVIKRQIEDNIENGEEDARLTETPYRNLMLDKWVLRTKERQVRHMLFLPQKVVWWDLWARVLQRRHSSRQWSPWKEIQLTTHPNEWMQYNFRLQYVVQNHRDQDKVSTFVVLWQLHEISSLESMTNRRRDVIRNIQPKFMY
jgi:hypothetical protein